MPKNLEVVSDDFKNGIKIKKMPPSKKKPMLLIDLSLKFNL
jgi:hypothetical protein